MKETKNNKAAAILDWLVTFLFFCGMALIAAGLWQIWPPVALVFLGIVTWYLAACINTAAKSPERTDKK